MSNPVDQRHLEILQHALGVDQYGRGDQYRSHFVTDEDGVDGQLCETLAAAGLMQKRDPRPAVYGGMDLYHVTDAGRAHVAAHSPAPPKLTRSQRRYRAWLDADCDVPFGEFLRRPTPVAADHL